MDPGTGNQFERTCELVYRQPQDSSRGVRTETNADNRGSSGKNRCCRSCLRPDDLRGRAYLIETLDVPIRHGQVQIGSRIGRHVPACT